MNDIAGSLALLQFGDSFFPSGAASFSWGLEGLAEAGVVRDAKNVRDYALGQLRGRWAEFERTIVVAAHHAKVNIAEVAAVDREVEIQTSCAEFRSASCRLGDAMLSVFGRLGIGDAASYRDMVKRGVAHGHIAAMQGYLWGRSGLSERDAVALSAHTFSTSLLGAAIRLGCLSHVDAQSVLILARSEAARLAQMPVPPIDALSSYAVEAEIAVMQHVNNDMRVFAN